MTASKPRERTLSSDLVAIWKNSLMAEIMEVAKSVKRLRGISPRGMG